MAISFTCSLNGYLESDYYSDFLSVLARVVVVVVVASKFKLVNLSPQLVVVVLVLVLVLGTVDVNEPRVVVSGCSSFHSSLLLKALSWPPTTIPDYDKLSLASFAFALLAFPL